MMTDHVIDITQPKKKYEGGEGRRILDALTPGSSSEGDGMDVAMWVWYLYRHIDIQLHLGWILFFLPWG